MSSARPNGKLMTGAIGGFLVGGAFLIMMVSGFSLGGGMSAMGGRAMGGLMLLAMLFLLGGTITEAIGWFGLGKMYGGMNGQAGFLSILVTTGMVLAVLSAVMGILALAQISMYLILFGIPLTALAGGLGMLSAKGSAESGGATLQIAGILLAVGGGVMLILSILGLAHVSIGSIAEILGWVALIGLIAGHIAAGAAMLGQRG